MKELVDVLKGLKRDLKQNKKIQVIEDSILISIPDDYMLGLFLKTDSRFKVLDKLFVLFTNIGIAWRSNEKGNVFLNGEFFFVNFHNAREWFLVSSYYNPLMNSDSGFSIKDEFMILEQHPEAGDGMDYIMRIPVEKNTIEIWGHDTKETNLFKLTLNLEQYVKAMCHFKCIYNWQWLFVIEEHRGKLDQDYHERLLKRLEILKEYFPELDIDKRDF